MTEKETTQDMYCENCGKLLPAGSTVYFFQDEQGFDLRDGFFCADCAEKMNDNGFLVFEKDFSTQESYDQWIEENDLEVCIHDAGIDDNTMDSVFRPRINGISCEDLVIIDFIEEK